MRRLRIVVLSFAAACACGAAVAGSASAALPELGRCVPVAGTGAFNKSNCIALSKTHTGNFEWAPGPGASPAVKEIFNGVTFETVTKIKINCSNAQLTGVYTGAKSERITKVLLQGCEDIGPRFKCYTNPLTPGTIESEVPLVGELGAIPGSTNPANPWAAWDLKAENSSAPILEFRCGEGGGTLLISFEGSVIGRVTKTNLMQSEFGMSYKQKEGKQIPSAFIEGPEDVLTMITRPFGAEIKTEQVGLAAGVTVTNSEPLEIKAKA